MEEITSEILDVDFSFKNTHHLSKTRNLSLRKDRILISSDKKDLRHYSMRTSFAFNSYYSKRREVDFRSSRLLWW
jgi:hypothetical protein